MYDFNRMSFEKLLDVLSCTVAQRIVPATWMKPRTWVISIRGDSLVCTWARAVDGKDIKLAKFKADDISIGLTGDEWESLGREFLRGWRLMDK
jgi:hypothetical protein